MIPKTLIQTEKRPQKQLKTKRHKRKPKLNENDDAKFRKIKRVKSTREMWGDMEKHGIGFEEWQKKGKKALPPKSPTPKSTESSKSKKSKKPKPKRSKGK